jgi:glyoxylase-like metal-dependent hydrolase (beta-lactamase superfamily II)
MKIAEGIYKISADSNVYLIEELAMVIDTGDPLNREIVRQGISAVMPLSEIKRVVFTHMHYDHIGNNSLFENAVFYASKESIEDYNSDPMGTVLKDIKIIKPLIIIDQIDADIRVISCPGHTRGSIVVFYKDVLFSGDTLFNRGHGRTDLPTSEPDKIEKSLRCLELIEYKRLCPGHDY